MAATAVATSACATTTRVASPGGKPVHVQQARVGMTLRTDWRNTVTVSAYRAAVAMTSHERAPHEMHFQAGELNICAVTSGGLVGPSMATLRIMNNSRVPAIATTVMRPQLKSQRLARGHCVRGWVAFDVPNTTTGAWLVVSDVDDDVMQWVVH